MAITVVLLAKEILSLGHQKESQDRKKRGEELVHLPKENQNHHEQILGLDAKNANGKVI